MDKGGGLVDGGLQCRIFIGQGRSKWPEGLSEVALEDLRHQPMHSTTQGRDLLEHGTTLGSVVDDALKGDHLT